MQNEWEKYQKIIHRLEKVPLVQPADDFTERVMAQLPELKFGMLDKVRQSLRQPRQASLNPRTISTGITPREGAFYFFMAAVFYLIVAFILLWGLKTIDFDFAATRWIKCQPPIAILTAAMFAILGIMFVLQLKIARILTSFCAISYIGLVVINVLSIPRVFDVFMSVIYVLAFQSIGIITIIILRESVERFLKKTEQKEGLIYENSTD